MLTIVKKAVVANKRHFGNIGWSLLGAVGPLIAAVVCIPVLLSALGMEGFGFLAIAWMIVGYFSLFDLGIGRAITFAVARDLSTGNDPTNLVGTGLKFLGAVGVAFGCILLLISDILVPLILKEGVTGEYVLAVRIVACAVPVVVVTAGVKGLLEAHGSFKIISAVTTPTGALMFILPSLVVLISPNIMIVCLSLVFVRVIQLILLGYFASAKYGLGLGSRFSMSTLRRLLAFGGWLSVSNVVSPIMSYMDRLFIGVYMTAGAVTQYVVPFDMITKALILPTAVLSVLFPQFSSNVRDSENTEKLRLMRNAMVVMAFVMGIPLAVTFVSAFQILDYWLGEEIAVDTYILLQVFTIGVFINSLAFVPYGLVQGMGRADLTAKAHLVELLFYLPFLIYMIGVYGTLGAAIAWVSRVLFDLVILLLMVRRIA